ncbi:MAG: CatB-related O-acetyltransferase [Cyanobacteria bacterium P01_H01_bin.119]
MTQVNDSQIELQNGPNPEHPFPIAAHPRVCFLKPVVRSPLIEIGNYTYYDDPDNPDQFEHQNVLYHYGPEKLKIGKFCAIATGVKFIMGGANHKLDGISTYPFPVLGHGWEIAMDQLKNLPNRGDTVVGNDVWIGLESVIMPGVTIGDGAIIAAKSVVVKDVDPYTVVGGNPAQVIKQRFSDRDIERLLTIQWWQWPAEKITQHIELIMAGEIEQLAQVN